MSPNVALNIYDFINKVSFWPNEPLALWIEMRIRLGVYVRKLVLRVT